MQQLEEEMQNLRMQPSLISPETILSHLSSEPIHVQDLIFRLKITDMYVARSLQIELVKLEASKKIRVLQKADRKFYYLKESITFDSD